MSIKVEKLVKCYGQQKALNNVSFEIKGSGVTGFLGPNGAGKSTIMKILSGMLSPTSGNVEVNGIDVLDCPQKVKSITGYLPEHNPLYTDMYVREFLDMTADIYRIGAKRKTVMEAMEMTGLMPEQHKKIGQLSKGYRQRVGLAQNLLHKPSVMLLDEPTTGLDPNQIVDIRNLIKELGREKTVMLSSHIMQEVEAMCDNILIINRGEIVSEGAMSSLKMQHSGTTVEIGFAETVDLSAFNDAAFVAGVEPAETASVFYVKSVNDSDIRADLFHWAVAHNFTVIQMQQKTDRLEDVFRLLTKQNE
jgi:ABC-2 type transport system ATP-binding protein